MSSSRFIQAVMAAIILVVSGCATSTPPEQSCESDEDCPTGQACDEQEGTCVRISTSTNSDNNRRPMNRDADGQPNDGSTSDVDSNNSAPDMGPNDGPDGSDNQDTNNGSTCSPACGEEEICDNGQCVSACDPVCEAPAVCTGGSCVLPDCSSVGQPCDPTSADQGMFGCVELENGDGVCLSKCDDPRAASDCPETEYCWPLGPVDVCVPSLCDGDADCTDGGTCIDFDNGFKNCLSAGTVAEGGACNPMAMTAECERGTACRQTSSGAGVCAGLCDPWASPSDCPANQACPDFFTFRTGLCNADLDPTGSEVFQQCFNPGAACDDAVTCFELGSTDFCLKYCRPGISDCDGVITPSGDSTVCDNYFFPGVREVGICWPPCDMTDIDPCGSGVCVDELCRIPCSPGSEVADCCNGNTPCPFTCTQNLCE